MKRHKFTALLEAITPICHGDTVTGVDNSTNIRLFMKSMQLVRGTGIRVPDISGNAVRSALVRRPLQDHMIKTLGLGKGSLPQAVMNLLYSGGNVKAGGKAPGDELELGHRARDLYPSLELLSGSVDNFILPKSRLAVVAIPIALEYAPRLELIAPELADEARKISIFDLMGEETRTRGTGEESAGNQMLYTYETMAAGARFHLEFSLDPWASPACLGALSVALEQWDGFFGGQGRQGRGRMALRQSDLPDPKPYLEHLEGHGVAMSAGLVDGTFGTGKVLCA